MAAGSRTAGIGRCSLISQPARARTTGCLREDRRLTWREHPMARYHATVLSQRSVTETFSYLATFSNAAQWDPGVLSAEQLDPGPVAAGTRFRLVLPFLGRPMSLTYHISYFRPDAEVVLEGSNGLIRSTDRISVAPDADGARVGYHADVRLRGPLSVLDPLLGRGFRVAADRATAGLARALSAETAPSG